MTTAWRLNVLVFALSAARPGVALAQSEPAAVRGRTAAEALQIVLDKNISEGGPLRGDGATIAGVLVGQSLTFPISSSSGAFSLRRLTTIGPGIVDVSMSGSFGSLFGERADTNGRRGLSVGFNFQQKRWGTLAGIALKGHALKLRAVYRNAVSGRPAGTSDDFSADIDYRTDVLVAAANYGLLNWFDVGVSVPWISARIDGVNRRVIRPPGGPESVVSLQRVTGESVGMGDVVVRLKARVFPAWGASRTGFQSELDKDRRGTSTGLKVAVGVDFRFPTGKTAELYLDCPRLPCVGGRTQTVPDLGLGSLTTKVLLVASGEVRRFAPYVNMSYFSVPSYACDERFSTTGRCKGAIFELDPVNNTQDAKNQNLSDELTFTLGTSYQLVPYRATLSFDVIGRRLIDAGQFYHGPARVIVRDQLDPSVSTEIESRPGHVDTVVGVAGMKVGFRKRWVAVGSVLFALNQQGLQPATTWLLGLERSLGR